MSQATGLLFPQLLHDFQVNPAQVGLASWMKGLGYVEITRIGFDKPITRYFCTNFCTKYKKKYIKKVVAEAGTSFTLGNACGLILGGGARMGRRRMAVFGLLVAIASSVLLLVASRR